MAFIFLLGPGHWASDAVKAPPPLAVRRRLAEIFRKDGHKVVIMEDDPDRAGEDIIEMFDRLLRAEGVTDIVVYWPPKAKMQATYDELILLRDRLEEGLLEIWVVHHSKVASIRHGEFNVLEAGGRSSYLTLKKEDVRAVIAFAATSAEEDLPVSNTPTIA